MKNKRGHIPQSLWEKIVKLPCVICGSSTRIEPDHITPVCKGGNSDESNLQPLCFQCNRRKGRGKSNEELLAYFRKNERQHWQRDEFIRTHPVLNSW